MRGLARRSHLVLFFVSFGTVAGCGPELPPPPVLKLDPASIPAPEGSARSVLMVLPGMDEDLELWAMAGQREAGDSQAVFRARGPVAGKPAATEAGVVREAVADGISALIVVPDGSPDLPAALAEAEEKGVPVVLLGDPVEPPPGKPPFTRVVPGSFDPAARQMVEAARADAKQLGLPEDLPAIILVDTGGDRYSKARVAAIKGATEAAGIKRVEMAPFDRGFDKAKAALLGALKAAPGGAMVFCDDDDALLAASRTRIDLNKQPMIMVGGFAGSRGMWDPTYYAHESSFIECRNEQLAKLAVWTALSRVRGEKSTPVVELAAKFNRGMGADPAAWQAAGTPLAPPPPQVEPGFQKQGQP